MRALVSGGQEPPGKLSATQQSFELESNEALAAGSLENGAGT